MGPVRARRVAGPLSVDALPAALARTGMPSSPPDVLWHGTVGRCVAAILREGLRPGRRQHVHLSSDPATAHRVGARRGRPVVLTVDALGAAWAGVVFLRSGNGVWLADHLPPAFVRR